MAKGDPTELNLSVLRRMMAGTVVMPNRVHAVSAPHVKRCMRAGLAVPVGSPSRRPGRVTLDRIALTSKGIRALYGSLSWLADHLARIGRWDGMPTERCECACLRGDHVGARCTGCHECRSYRPTTLTVAEVIDALSQAEDPEVFAVLNASDEPRVHDALVARDGRLDRGVQ